MRGVSESMSHSEPTMRVRRHHVNRRFDHQGAVGIGAVSKGSNQGIAAVIVDCGLLFRHAAGEAGERTTRRIVHAQWPMH